MASHEAMHVARREADDARASCAGQDAVGARINQGINTPPPIPDFDPRQMADAANVHLFIHDQTATNLGSGGHSPRGPSAERPRARSPPTRSPRSNPRARSPPPRGAVAGAAAVSLEEFAGIVDRKKMEKEEVRTAPPLCPTRRRLSLRPPSPPPHTRCTQSVGPSRGLCAAPPNRPARVSSSTWSSLRCRRTRSSWR